MMDTHAVIGTLTKDYKVTEKQAEAIVYAVQQGQNMAIQGLATKEDVAGLDRRLIRVESDLNIIKWSIPLAIAFSTVIIKFL